MEETENYKKVKSETPLDIQIQVLEDITKKQQSHIESLEKQLAIQGVSKRTLKRICEHEDCNKEFTVELNLYGDKSKANVAMMQCPHCDKRNDLWLELS